MTQLFVGGILVSIIGLLLFIDPNGVLKMTARAKIMNAAENSPALKMIIRIAGLIALSIGMLVCFGILK